MRVLMLDLGIGALKVCLWESGRLVTRATGRIETRHAGERAEQDAMHWCE